MWKQRIIQAVWILAGAGTVTLLVAAMQKESARPCSGISVEVSGDVDNVFIDQKDIEELLKRKGNLEGAAAGSIDLRNMEELLEKDPWIRNAELFFDNALVLQVRITERQPVARVFTVMGNSFYLDGTGKVLPLSEKRSARVPVFTGFPFGKKLSKPDSALLKDVITMSNYIIADSFWNAQVAQVDIVGNEFDIVPVVGSHIVRFGDVSDIDKKFRKLFSFYKNVSRKVGFDRYEIINLQYEGQVVATRRGATIPLTDSAAAMQHLQQPLAATQEMTGDYDRTNSRSAEQDYSNGTGQRPREPRAVMRRD